MGIDLGKFARLLAAQGLTLPDGTHQTEMGTLVVKDGAVITVLSPEMITTRRSK